MTPNAGIHPKLDAILPGMAAGIAKGTLGQNAGYMHAYMHAHDDMTQQQRHDTR